MTFSELVGKLEVSDIIATLALIISGGSIFWNIYRDVLLKPRLKVRIQISGIAATIESVPKKSFIDFTVTNHGPGNITCEAIIARKRALFRWLKPRYSFIMPDYTNRLSARLPKKLDIGERITLLLPYEEKVILAYKPTHIGIKDSFGRIHWAGRKSLKLAIDTYLKDFSPEEWGK